MSLSESFLLKLKMVRNGNPACMELYRQRLVPSLKPSVKVKSLRQCRWSGPGWSGTIYLMHDKLEV